MCIARAGSLLAALLFVVGCAHGPSSDDQTRTLRLTFGAAAHHYRYHTSLNGTERVANGSPVPATADYTADAVWQVLGVDRNGAATIDQGLSNISPTAQASAQAQHWQFKLTPDGQVTASTPPQGETPTVTVPGSTQFVAILPDRPVKPGESWTRTITQPLPAGGGATLISARSHFDRYATTAGSRVAVISSQASAPFDFTVPTQQPASGRTPATTRNLRYQGTLSSRSETWLDLGGDQLVRVDDTVTTDFTETLQGDARGPVHFTGTYMLQLDQA